MSFGGPFGTPAPVSSSSSRVQPRLQSARFSSTTPWSRQSKRSASNQVNQERRIRRPRTEPAQPGTHAEFVETMWRHCLPKADAEGFYDDEDLLDQLCKTTYTREQKLSSMIRTHRVQPFMESSNNAQNELECVRRERDTWALIGYLLSHRGYLNSNKQRPMVDGWSMLDDGDAVGACKFGSFYSSMGSAREPTLDTCRLQRIVHWLEHLATIDAQFDLGSNADDRDFYMNRTRQRLATSYEADTSLVEHLDPDAPIRESRNVMREDEEEEEALLSNVWQFVRSGDLDGASALCNEYRQFWRAATLSGGKLYDFASGNKNRFLWQKTCCKISETAKSTYEAAIFGVLGNDLNGMKELCHTWEDFLWAYAKHTLTLRFDFYYATLLSEAHVTMAVEGSVVEQCRDLLKYWRQQFQLVEDQYPDAWSTDAMLDTVHFAVPDKLKPCQQDPYRRLQVRLAKRLRVPRHSNEGGLSEYYWDNFQDRDYVFKELRDVIVSLSGEDLSPVQTTAPKHVVSFLRFAAHLYIFLMDDERVADRTGPRTDYGEKILVPYIKYLEQTGQYNLIAGYLASLPSRSMQIDYYAALLRRTPADMRDELLKEARQHMPQSVEEIRKAMVQSILEDTSGENVQMVEDDPSAFKIGTARVEELVSPSKTAVSTKLKQEAGPLYQLQMSIDPAFIHDVTEADREKIDVVKAFAADQKEEHYYEVMFAINKLLRYFVSQAKYQAMLVAKEDLEEEFFRAKAFRLDVFANRTVFAMLLVNCQRELLAWSDFITCLFNLNAWLTIDRRLDEDQDEVDLHIRITDQVGKLYDGTVQLLQTEQGFLQDSLLGRDGERDDVLSEAREKVTGILRAMQARLQSELGQQEKRAGSAIELERAMRQLRAAELSPVDQQAIDGVLTAVHQQQKPMFLVEDINTAFRHFACGGHYFALKKLNDELEPKYNAIVGSLTGPRNLEQALVNLTRELECWRAFAHCLRQTYDAFDNSMSAQPRQQSAKHALSTVEHCTRYNGGFLCDVIGQRRQQELDQARKSAVPFLVESLQMSLREAKQFRRSMGLASLVADETLALYRNFESQRLRQFIASLSATELSQT